MSLAIPRPDVCFRSGELEDAEQIADILLRVRLAFMPYLPSAHSEPEMLGWVRAVLLPTGGVSVATLDGDAIGVSAVAVRSGIGWIDQMSVVPEMTGQAIGTALLRDALSRVPAPVRLYTFQLNTGARRFYERHGFRVIAVGDGSGNEERCPDVLFERSSVDFSLNTI